MRLNYALLLTLVFVLFAYPNTVSAGASTTIETVGTIRRFLRSLQAAHAVHGGEIGDDEERVMTTDAIAGLRLQNKWLQDAMLKSLDEWTEAHLAANAATMVEKETEMIQILLMGRIAPSKVFKSLKLDELVDAMDEAAKLTPRYKFYKSYEITVVNALRHHQ